VQLIEGFEKARATLSRSVATDFESVSPGLRKRLRGLFDTESPEAVVREMIGQVACRGDEAIFDYALKIDGLRLDSLEVSREEIDMACRELAPELIAALELAAGRICAFHEKQKEGLGAGFSLGEVGQLVRPLGRVGVYAPGGKAAYPSTVLMTAIPARVAGVGEIILATVPRVGGRVPPATLAAARIAGVDRVFCVGGAPAIAALALGTKSIPRVDKICGPGNIFVTLAKKLVYGRVDIDGLAGPSEIVIVADETANPTYCAADLLAQAEHDPLASAILITNSQRLASEVSREVERQLSDLPGNAAASESLSSRGWLVVVDSLEEAITLANLYAPEHLALFVKDAARYVERITGAGCVFLGSLSTVVLGDYVAGPSHVLPTGGTARFGSPLSVVDFLKFTSVVNVGKGSVAELGEAAVTVARAEGFEAHARAMEARLKEKPGC
jgi:histidinol dehydrogenase